uniref:Uncharacterized protein n=1 Tax=Ixodes ricinus TaxID=34613 RepID=A0A6B0U9V3_IXORI
MFWWTSSCAVGESSLAAAAAEEEAARRPEPEDRRCAVVALAWRRNFSRHRSQNRYQLLLATPRSPPPSPQLPAHPSQKRPALL